MKYTQYLSLALLAVALVASYVECKPQITFSTDWYGGKRSAPSASAAFDDKLELDKKAPGWGKRAPGWGKRAPLQRLVDSVDSSDQFDGDSFPALKAEISKAMHTRDEVSRASLPSHIFCS